VALDQNLPASDALCVFETLDHARQIAGIDVAQAGVAADFRGADQIFRLRVRGIVHFVVFVERGDMPGNLRRNTGNEFGKSIEFIVGVVETGDEQSDKLEPNAHRVQSADGVENRSDAAAEFVVMAIAETLEVDLVQIDPGVQIFENLWRGVAVRDESGDKARSFCFLKDGHGPLGRDERLVIRTDENSCALAERVLY
jgi:hypothetical protein